MTPPRSWFPIIVLGLLSCTIVEDDDITSTAEAVNLSLKSITISQKTVKGNGTLEIEQLYDSVVNFTDAATNTKITRMVEYSIPALGALKLKLRSGSTSATSMTVLYTDFGKPYTAYIQEEDSVIERYRFRYSAAKQLNKITTIIDPIDNQPATVITNDTLIYAGNQIGTLTRRIGGVSTTYNVQYRTSNDDSFVSSLNQSGATQGNGNVFEQPQTWGGCESASCAVYQRTSQSGNQQSSAVIIVSSFQVNAALVNLNFQDFRQTGSGIAPRETDIYYFHPLMVLRGQHTDGEHLLAIYLLDWWVPGTASSTNPLNDHEHVTFSYTY